MTGRVIITSKDLPCNRCDAAPGEPCVERGAMPHQLDGYHEIRRAAFHKVAVEQARFNLGANT